MDPNQQQKHDVDVVVELSRFSFDFYNIHVLFPVGEKYESMKIIIIFTYKYYDKNDSFYINCLYKIDLDVLNSVTA
jgi:hypothetical protein